MIRAIDEYTIVGCETTLPFCSYVMKHEAFTSGNFDTNFVKLYFTPEVLKPDFDEEELLAAAIVAKELQSKGNTASVGSNHPQVGGFSAWKLNRS
jgi:propionyl-CoA carboxylase alpha chain